MPDKFSEIQLHDIQVLCVQTVGVRASAKAFIDLEKKIGSLKGRKFYGTLLGDPTKGTYRACVEARTDESALSLGLETWTIPSGKYLRAKISNWPGKEYLISEHFKAMSATQQTDYSRPYIEYYRSVKELILLLPISK